jgi:GntR family transcriptional regulator, vanillate catabolism transcriptional regulator
MMHKSASDLSAGLVRQQVVVDRLREMIMTGELGGGERLLEIPLSAQLNVSRTPLREALIILAEDGLVEYRPNRGYVVRNFTLDYIMDAYDVRESLEGLACRLAAERGIDDATFAEMDAVLREGDRILFHDGLKEEMRIPLREINDTFHRFIIAASGNTMIGTALSSANNIPYASSRVAHWFEEGDVDGLSQLRAFHAQHHALLRAIRAGQGYRAETIMRSHIAASAEAIRQQLAKDASKIRAIDDDGALRTVS